MMSDAVATIIADDDGQIIPYMIDSDSFKIKTMVFYEFIKTVKIFYSIQQKHQA